MDYLIITIVVAAGLIYIMSLASKSKKGQMQIKNRHARRRR